MRQEMNAFIALHRVCTNLPSSSCQQDSNTFLGPPSPFYPALARFSLPGSVYPAPASPHEAPPGRHPRHGAVQVYHRLDEPLNVINTTQYTSHQVPYPHLSIKRQAIA